MFKLTHNHEAYCFLKHNLPEEFSIQANPSPEYYTEDYFHYIVYKDGKITEAKKGQFSKLGPNELTWWAQNILTQNQK